MTYHSHCRACPGRMTLIPLMDLGAIPLSTFVKPETVEGDEPCAPLALGLCPRCRSVQLEGTVNPELLYRNYWYQSGINERMVTELGDIVIGAVDRGQPGPTDYVLDIGANDGTLLGCYKNLCGPRAPLRIGVEPAFNLQRQLQEHCELTHNDFFPPPSLDVLTSYVKTRGVKIITTIAMFYDLDDPNAFVHACKELLHPDGVWVIQFQDLAGMLQSAAFDNICHEHLQYYSLFALKRVLSTNAFEVYDVEPRTINGGSLRAYVGHRTESGPRWATPSGTTRVLDQLEREDHAGLLDTRATQLQFDKLEARIREVKQQVHSVIGAHGGVVDGYGASTKGNTLLPVLGLNATHVRQIAERNPAKVGLETVGTRIPIVSEESWRETAGKATLVPIWQFRGSLLTREADYLRQGGSFIFPLPQVEVVRG